MKHVVTFAVLGFTPIPWTVPNFGLSKHGHRFSRRTRKSNPAQLSPDLDRWQSLIREEAGCEMAGMDPSDGPCKVVVSFIERTPTGRRHGQLWFPGIQKNGAGEWSKVGNHEPDLTNLVKAVEDAIEGVVYRNDVQVRMHEHEMVYGATPGISVLVQEIEESDFPGWGDLVPAEETLRPHRRRKRKAIPDDEADAQV